MSLATRLTDLATRIATEVKSVRTLVNGNAVDNSSLTTTAKTNLVAAINEVNFKPTAGINDTTPSNTSVYSSNKTAALIATAKSDLVNGAGAALDTFKELQDALGGDANFATTTANALGNRLRFDAAQTLTTGQQTQGQSNLNVPSNTSVGNTDTNFVTVFESGLI